MAIASAGVAVAGVALVGGALSGFAPVRSLAPAVRAGGAAGGGVAGTCALFLRSSAVRYADGAPPGHTGGFGEPTCERCHFHAEASEEGRLELSGLPAAWEPGREYPLEVSVRSPGMARAGFQLAARFCDGGQAGTWRAGGDGVGVVSADDAGVRYVGHTEPARPGAAGAAAWRLTWIAPEEAGGTVLLHLAANAANGDDSEFGDAVYADSLRSVPLSAESEGGEDGGVPRRCDGTKEGR